jgi:hypothetical protein
MSNIWLVRWKQSDEKKQFMLLPLNILLRENSLKKDHYFKHTQFSPDGKWLLMVDIINRESPQYYVFPVEEDNPLFLGTPKHLRLPFEEKDGEEIGVQPKSIAWIAKPLSLVATDGKILYKWVLPVK